MIEPAKISEIPDILDLTKSCRLRMESNGIFQWTTEYPSKQQFITDAHRKELYVIKENRILIGCIVLSVLMDEEYQNVKWVTENEANLYIHRLGIHANYQGQGFAQKLMDFAENYARTNNFTSVRLDTFSQNKRNQYFYEKRGYQKLEDIFYLNQSEHPFHCYELVL